MKKKPVAGKRAPMKLASFEDGLCAIPKSDIDLKEGDTIQIVIDGVVRTATVGPVLRSDPADLWD